MVDNNKKETNNDLKKSNVLFVVVGLICMAFGLYFGSVFFGGSHSGEDKSSMNVGNKEVEDKIKDEVNEVIESKNKVLIDKENDIYDEVKLGDSVDTVKSLIDNDEDIRELKDDKGTITTIILGSEQDEENNLEFHLVFDDNKVFMKQVVYSVKPEFIEYITKHELNILEETFGKYQFYNETLVEREEHKDYIEYYEWFISDNVIKRLSIDNVGDNNSTISIVEQLITKQ